MISQEKIKWIKGDLESFINEYKGHQGYQVLIVDLTDSVFDRLNNEYGDLCKVVDKSGFVSGMLNILTLPNFINIIFATRFSKEQPGLHEMSINVVGYEKTLALSPYLNVQLPFLPNKNQQSMEHLANIVFKHCIYLMEESAIFDHVKSAGSDIAIEPEFIEYWENWWKKTSVELNVKMLDSLSFVTELASSFAYVNEHLTAKDLDLSDGGVAIRSLPPSFPLAQQAVEFRYAKPYSIFISTILIVPIRQVLRATKDVVVFDEVGVNLVDEDFSQGSIDGSVGHKLNFAGSISHNATVEVLSNIDVNDSVVLTDMVDSFDEEALGRGNVFSTLDDVLLDSRGCVHLFYHFDSSIALFKLINKISSSSKKIIFHLSPRMFSGLDRVKANALLLKGTDKYIRLAFDMLKQSLVTKDAKKRAQLLEFIEHINPITTSVVKLLSVDRKSLAEAQQNSFSQYFAAQCKSTSVLQSKCLMNMSLHDA